MIQAFFRNIESTIISHIQQAENDIKIAIAWFTNKEILGELENKLSQGIKITLLVSDDIINSRLNKENYVKSGGLLKIIPTDHNKFLHEKFLIIDEVKLITGSYNYTYYAEYHNYESVILTDDERTLQQYLFRFKSILDSAIEYEQKGLITNLSINFCKGCDNHNNCGFNCGYCKPGKKHFCKKCNNKNSFHRSNLCNGKMGYCNLNCQFCKSGHDHMCRNCGALNHHKTS